MPTTPTPQDELASAKEMPATLGANANALLAQFDAMSRTLAETSNLPVMPAALPPPAMTPPGASSGNRHRAKER